MKTSINMLDVTTLKKRKFAVLNLLRSDVIRFIYCSSTYECSFYLIIIRERFFSFKHYIVKRLSSKYYNKYHQYG